MCLSGSVSLVLKLEESHPDLRGLSSIPLVPPQLTLILSFYPFHPFTGLVSGKRRRKGEERWGELKNWWGLYGFAVLKSFLEQSVGVGRRMDE